VNTPVAPAQSNFVTVLAWILIVFGCLGIFVSLMQNVMVTFVFPQMPAPSQESYAFPLTAFRIMAATMLTVTAFFAYAAYALLRRRNWARRTYVVLFLLSAAWNVISALMFTIAIFFGASLPLEAFPMPSGADVAFKAFIVTFAVFALAMATLFVWLAKRLRSPAIKAEFQGVPSVT
jgi:hypothetical protein